MRVVCFFSSAALAFYLLHHLSPHPLPPPTPHLPHHLPLQHAYYLQYKNMRADYLNAIWNVVNFGDVGKRLAEAQTLQ